MNEDTEARYKRQRAESRVNFEIILGHVEIQTREVPSEKGGISFQGRSLRYDRHGALVETTPWAENCRMYWPDPEPESPPLSWFDLFLAGIVIAVVLMAVFQPVQVGSMR